MKQVKDKDVEFYCKEIEYYDKKFGKWEERSDKIIKRYADDREDSKAQFNILWSNTQTLAPAVYSKQPKPNIERRYQDDDDAGLEASRVLERSSSYYVDQDEFDYTMKQVVLDYLLPGRGQAWVRYDPYFEDMSVDVGDDEITEDIPEDIKYEDVAVDYVHWKDFGHSWARTWEETRCVWRCVYMSRKEVKGRFGDIASQVSFEEKDGDKVIRNKAKIYEIWDKVTKKVVWVCKECPEKLDEKDDLLGLKGFFPCPKPLFSTVTNDNLIPTPFYVQYQDQAIELDELTARINSITDAIKVSGVYDASAQGLENILASGSENKLIAVESWAVHAEKGGLKGVIDFLPMQDIVQTLLSLYDARERVKQDLYEITGISDIIRGASEAGETATAQRIKGQFATLRLDSMQAEVQRFSRDLVRIIAEIIAEHFEDDSIKQISGIRLLSEYDKDRLQGLMKQGSPIPEEAQKLAQKPTWEEVFGLIRDDMTRCFRISIETDSTIKSDQEAEKRSRIEFLQAVGTFMRESIQLPPELAPLAGEMLMFGVRGFKTGRELEQSMKATLEQLKQKAQQPQQGNQLEAQAQKTEMEMKQADIQMKQMDLQMKQADIRIKELELENKKQEGYNEQIQSLNQPRVDQEGRNTPNNPPM